MNKSLKIVITFFTFFQITACKNEPSKQIEQIFFVGGYTSEEMNAEGKGISTCSINTETGEMKLVHSFEKSKDPSYLAVHPNGKYLYAANETGEKSPGYVSAYKIEENKALQFNNERYTNGDYPCYLSITSDNKYLLVANYGGGSVSLFPILEDGSLDKLASLLNHSGNGPFTERQEAAHAHYFGPGINDSTAFSIDLGTDKIYHYRIKNNGRLGISSVTNTTPGTGPRHLVFHPTLKCCYVVTEFNNKIEAYHYSDENTPFNKFQTVSTLEEELPFYAATSSAIKIHPNGRFLYAANRGIPDAEEDNIAMFSIHPQSGELYFLGNIGTKGKIPRDFEIDHSGKILIVANQKSNNLASFKINPETGMLTPTTYQLFSGTPTCVKFLNN